MKVFFDEKFLQTYTSDPAASPGRLDYAFSEVKKRYSLVAPRPCSEEDVRLVHTAYHFEYTRRDEKVYPMAILAAGAAIGAAETALNGEAAFALCRPPGHHASPDSAWGFCYFNNVAIAVSKLLSEKRIKKALIIDFDLHYGDGTANTFSVEPGVLAITLKATAPGVCRESEAYLLGARLSWLLFRLALTAIGMIGADCSPRPITRRWEKYWAPLPGIIVKGVFLPRWKEVTTRVPWAML